MNKSQIIYHLFISISLASLYLIIWKYLNKIASKYAKAFIGGTITCLFVHYFLVNFIYPLQYFLYAVLNVPDHNALFVLIVIAYAKKIAIYSGLIVTAIILFKKQLLDSLLIKDNFDNN